MVENILTWYVITTKEKLDIKSHFLAPWSDTPEAYVTTFGRQLDMPQIQCKDHGVTITYNDKVDHFMYQIYVCEFFNAQFLDNWEETANKLWGATHTHFTRQFNKER